MQSFVKLQDIEIRDFRGLEKVVREVSLRIWRRESESMKTIIDGDMLKRFVMEFSAQVMCAQRSSSRVEGVSHVGEVFFVPGRDLNVIGAGGVSKCLRIQIVCDKNGVKGSLYEAPIVLKIASRVFWDISYRMSNGLYKGLWAEFFLGADGCSEAIIKKNKMIESCTVSDFERWVCHMIGHQCLTNES